MRKAIYTLLMLLLTPYVFAQKTQVVLYKDQLSARFDTVNCIKNVIKLNPLLFLAGEVPIYYERALSPKLSVELGIGVTLRNYVGLYFDDNVDDFGDGTEVNPELALHVAGRYYLTEDLEPHGWYVGPEYAHRTFSKHIRERNTGGGFSDRKRHDLRRYDDLKVILGYQSISGSSNWLIDIYGGLGARNRDLTKVEETNNLDGTWTYPPSRTVKDIVPAFFLGFKIGVGF